MKQIKNKTLLWRGWCTVDRDNTIWQSFTSKEEALKFIENARAFDGCLGIAHTCAPKYRLVRAETRAVR